MPQNLKKSSEQIWNFLTFPACFEIPMIFSNLNFNCSNLLDMRNLCRHVASWGAGGVRPPRFCRNRRRRQAAAPLDFQTLQHPCLQEQAFCYKKLFWPKFCKFSAFSLEFQIFFSITGTIFSHSRSELILATKYHF